jgi:hypothetical protein
LCNILLSNWYYLTEAKGLEFEILNTYCQYLFWSLRSSSLPIYVLLIDCNEISLPARFATLIPQLSYPLPSPWELKSLLTQHYLNLLKPTQIDDLVPSVTGLSEAEVNIGLSLVNNHPDYNADDANILCLISDKLLEYKKLKLSTYGLEFIVPDIGDFGGLDRLKKALEDVRIDFSPEARQLNLPLPKGWLLTGPPGTGKTFSAKVCAQKLGFPLINVGIDQVKVGGVDALKRLLIRLEASAPAVIYFDEFDKFFITNNQEDGNSKAVLGVLLNWLQEKTSATFVIASLNRLDALPSEITRAGRFDQLFYVGFPLNNERVEILKIHCSRFDSRWTTNPPLTFEQWRILLQKTQNCTGAELRAMVESAARNLFRQGRPLEITFDSLVHERSLMTPLYYRDTERIIAIENRAKNICEPASSPDSSSFASPVTSLWG